MGRLPEPNKRYPKTLIFHVTDLFLRIFNFEKIAHCKSFIIYGKISEISERQIQGKDVFLGMYLVTEP